MQIRITALIMFLVLGLTAYAQQRSAEIELFLNDARSLTDETRKLRSELRKHLEEAQRWEPAGKDQQIWKDVEKLARGAEICERKVEDSSEPARIEESILQVFVRMAQVNDTSNTVELNAATRTQIMKSKTIARNMLVKYAKRKGLDLDWELAGGRTDETSPEAIAKIQQSVQVYLNREYAYPIDSITVARVARLGKFHVAEVNIRGKIFKIVLDQQTGQIVFERNFTPPQ